MALGQVEQLATHHGGPSSGRYRTIGPIRSTSVTVTLPNMEAQVAYVRLALDERRLLWERGALSEEIEEAEDEGIGGLQGQPGDAPEAAAAMFEREKDSGLVEDLDAALAEIADARRRIEAGAYGLCEMCNQEIDEARLEILPAARFCVEHAREHERPLGGVDL